jgi:nucleotide-binding universal stress UspA family protein
VPPGDVSASSSILRGVGRTAKSVPSRIPTIFHHPRRLHQIMKVLLGIGGGDDSLRALEQTVSRAAEADDDLTVAVVDDPGGDRPIGDIESEVDAMLDDAGLDAEIRHVGDDAGSELVRIAESEGFDRIALGGGTTSPMGKIQLGRTAQFVLLNAHTTVSLVR